MVSPSAHSHRLCAAAGTHIISTAHRLLLRLFFLPQQAAQAHTHARGFSNILVLIYCSLASTFPWLFSHSIV